MVLYLDRVWKFFRGDGDFSIYASPRQQGSALNLDEIMEGRIRESVDVSPLKRRNRVPRHEHSVSFAASYS